MLIKSAHLFNLLLSFAYSFIRTFTKTTVTRTVIDADGNIVHKEDNVQSQESSSGSDTSPTLDDVVYKEYPHLSKPIAIDNDQFEKTSTHYTVQKYYHTSNQPFEMISSLRAHYVQPLYENHEFEEGIKDQNEVYLDNMKKSNDVNANVSFNSRMQQNAGSDIFKNSPKHFQNNLAFQVGKFEDDVESGLELMSSELMSTPRMPGSTIESGLPESLDLDTDKTIEGEFQSLDFITDLEMDSPKLAKDKELEAARTEVNLLMSTVTQAALEIRSDVKEMLPDLTPTPDSKTPLSEFKQFLESQESEKNKQESEVKEWVKPLLAGKCLQERKFWGAF